MKILRFFLAGIVFSITLLLLLPVLLLSLPLLVYSFTNSLIYKFIKFNTVTLDKLYEFDPELGWRPKPNLDLYYMDYTGDRCSIITDAAGWPGNITIEKADLVVLGDSFAFGYGSYFENSYIKAGNKLKIKSLGIPGYNMVQQVLVLEKYAKALRGKRVAWFVCIENDVFDNLLPYTGASYSTPFLVECTENDKWRIEQSHVVEAKKGYKLRMSRNHTKFYANISRDSAFSRRVYAAVDYLIRRASDICDKNDISLLLMGIPYKFHLTKNGIEDKLNTHLPPGETFNAEYIDARFSEMCQQNQINYVPLREYLSIDDYKKYDTHWNNKGNLKIAHLLEQFVKEQKINKLSVAV